MKKELAPLSTYPKRTESDKEKRAQLVQEAINMGYVHNEDIAEALQATPGQIAGIRRRHKISLVPEKHSSLQPAKEALSSPEPPHAGPTEERAKGSNLPPLKVAASEAAQCKAFVRIGSESKRCAFERLPGSKFCAMHKPKK